MSIFETFEPEEAEVSLRPSRVDARIIEALRGQPKPADYYGQVIRFGMRSIIADSKELAENLYIPRHTGDNSTWAARQTTMFQHNSGLWIGIRKLTCNPGPKNAFDEIDYQLVVAASEGDAGKPFLSVPYEHDQPQRVYYRENTPLAGSDFNPQHESEAAAAYAFVGVALTHRRDILQSTSRLPTPESLAAFANIEGVLDSWL